MALVIKNQKQLVALMLGLARAQITNGLRAEAAIRWGVISGFMFLIGIPAPIIISGFRSLAKQRALKLSSDRFPNASDFHPVADRSWHTEGLAIDVTGTQASISFFSRFWKLLGGRDGAEFSTPDPGHFDLPLNGVVPKSISGMS